MAAWFLAVFVGMPVMAVCLVTAPGDTDRIGSAVGLVVTTLIGWLGLKAIDARIGRRRLMTFDRNPDTK